MYHFSKETGTLCGLQEDQVEALIDDPQKVECSRCNAVLHGRQKPVYTALYNAGGRRGAQQAYEKLWSWKQQDHDTGCSCYTCALVRHLVREVVGHRVDSD